MGLTVNDIRRAIIGSGETSTFTEIYGQSLNGEPVPVITNLDADLELPDPDALLKATNTEVAPQMLFSSKHSVDLLLPQTVDLVLSAISEYGDNSSFYIEHLIDEIKPDIIAIDCSTLELAANIRYAFSLPCAVNLSFRADIQHNDTKDIYFSKSFHPGDVAISALTKSWLTRTPILPIGKPLKPAELTYIPSQGFVDLNYSESSAWKSRLTFSQSSFNNQLVGVFDFQIANEIGRQISSDLVESVSQSKREKLIEESCYLVSRISDIAAYLKSAHQKQRILVLVDIAHFKDVEYVIDLIKQGITEEIYVDPEREVPISKLRMSGSSRDYLDTSETEEIHSSKLALATRLFCNRFDKWLIEKDSEILSQEQESQLLTEITCRIRNSPEISQGVSVRGSIAFAEIARSLALINGGITREHIGKAALIALKPRIALKHSGDPATIITDITKEVLYGFQFSTMNEIAINQLRIFTTSDILNKLNEMGQIPQEKNLALTSGAQPAVVSEKSSDQEILKYLEKMNYLKKNQQGQYSLTRKALEQMLKELDAKLKSGEITAEEHHRQAASLMSKMQNHTQPQFKMSAREKANTIMEMMDAQDKQWNREINFQNLRTYYHIKENSEKMELSPEKRDYYSLQKLIDDLEKQRILVTADSSAGYLLSGMALSILLKHLINEEAGKNIKAIKGPGKMPSFERNHEVRRYSSGDAFRDISIRHTLKETARQKRALSEFRRCDLRVFLKQPHKPQSDIVICMDTSGSMGFHQKLMYARLVAAGLAQAAIKEKSRVGLVAFNDSGQVSIPLTDTDADKLLNCIAGLSARGNTNIGEGIKSSRSLLTLSSSRNQKHIVLISDGQPTAISSSAFTLLKERQQRDLTEESALMETKQAVNRGIQLSVIHISGENETGDDFIRNIARAGKGKIQRIRGPEDLKSILR